MTGSFITGETTAGFGLDFKCSRKSSLKTKTLGMRISIHGLGVALEKNEMKNLRESTQSDGCEKVDGEPRIFWIVSREQAVKSFL